MSKNKVITCCDDFCSTYFPESFASKDEFDPQKIGKQIAEEIFCQGKDKIESLITKNAE